MQPGEEGEFNCRISMCGPLYAKSSLQKFKHFNPCLELNPNLEFRVVAYSHVCLTFVRPADWEKIEAEQRAYQRRNSKKIFWGAFPFRLTVAVVIALVIGVVFLVVAGGGQLIFHLHPNYWHAFGFGFGIVMLVRVLRFGWVYLEI